jgi:hypothetical protein
MPFSDNKQLKSAFFHSLSKVQTNITQNPYESSYKSGHSVFDLDVFSEPVPYAVDTVAADANVSNYPTRLAKYSLNALTMVPGSNGQAYYLDVAGTYVKPFINPVDIPASDGTPSFGYDVRLYKEDGTRVFPTQGNWNVDFYGGIILFDVGYTPADLGWGTPKITCYVYVGKNLRDSLAGIVGGTTFQDPVLSKDNFDPSLLSPSEGDRQVVGGESYAILSTDLGNNTFTVSGDQTTIFVNGQQFLVRESSNDGQYTVDSSTFDTTNTIITVQEPIVNPVVLQGNIKYAYGDWNGKVNYISTYKSGVWASEVAEKGYVLYVNDVNKLHNYNGLDWVDIGSSSSADAIQTDDTNFNYFLTATETDVQLALDKLDKVLFEANRVYRESTDFTPTEYGLYVVDTTGGDVTITLPEITGVSDEHVLMEFINTGTNSIIFTTTQNINGAVGDITLSTTYEKVSVVSEWNGASGEWFYVRTKQITEILNSESYEHLDLTTGVTTYALTSAPILPLKSKVFLNGVKISRDNAEYTFSGSSIVLNETNLDLLLETGMELELYYY